MMNPELALKDTNIDGGWAWMVVFASFMIHLIADGLMYTFGIFYVELRKYFNATEIATSLVMSILMGVSFCIGPLSSALTNKYGCRVVSILGTLVAFSGLLLSLPVPHIAYLYFTIGILAGSGIGLMAVPGIAAVSCYFEKKRAIATGLAVSGTGFGGLILAPLLEWLIDFYDWKGAMLISAGLILNCAVFSSLYRPFCEPKQEILPPVETITIESELAATQENANEMTAEEHALGYILQSSAKHSESDVFRQIGNILFDSEGNVSYVVSKASSSEPGLLSQPDIFYRGNLQKSSELKIVSSPEPTEIPEEEKICPKEITNIILEMVDISLMKDYTFLIFAVGNFLISFGIYAPLVYMTSRAKQLGITMKKASLLLATIGFSSTIGRIIFCCLADITTVKSLYIYIACLFFNGISTMFCPLASQYYQLAIYCVVFGLTTGSCVSLTSIILVDLLGMSKLNNAYGLILLIVGIATSVGTPFTGWIHDQTGSYDIGFYISGSLIVTSSLILLFIPLIQKKSSL
ncbi:monocarboxylate transporter 1-like [Stegodyphus dumicola]|uniref:monocarboxylate transporter 1-like n=1 Tax=Stegodyphus dumicola TaxID=202533 RepID=UPI0015AF1184|nr:monocarboxylate transporter 1-like [Stegodyphus dumicola]